MIRKDIALNLVSLLQKDTSKKLVSLMQVNNEIGNINGEVFTVQATGKGFYPIGELIVELESAGKTVYLGKLDQRIQKKITEESTSTTYVPPISIHECVICRGDEEKKLQWFDSQNGH